MAIQILNDVALHGGIEFLDSKSEFPENPRIGTMILKGTAIYAYISIGGMETWYPFANKTNSYVHTQGLPSSTWFINHNLHTTDVWTQIKDSSGKIVMATVTTIDTDNIRIDFTTALTGTAFIVAPDSIEVPEIKATLITVGPNVEINTNGVLINGSYALTSASIEQQIDSAIDQEASLRQSADASLQTAITNETSARQTTDTFLQNAINAEVSTRQESITTLTNNLSKEVSDRQAADSALQSDITNGLATKVDISSIGVTVASLVNGIVPSTQLPSYVDDVIEFSSISAFPATGESGKIYVSIDTNKTYRWSGSQYVEISAAPGSTDSIAEGVNNLYFTDARARAAVTTITGNAGTASKWQTARTETLSGDVTGSASVDGSANWVINTTLSNSGVTAGTYNNSATSITPITVDSKGRVTGTGSEVTITPAFSSITGKPTTLSGYGITDAQPLDSDLTAIAAINSGNGILKRTALGSWVIDSSVYLTSNQTITVSGDASGSGSTSISLTLSNSGVNEGTYPKVTVDSKGRVISGTSLSATDIPSLDWSIITTGKPTTLSGYGITDAVSSSGNNLPLNSGNISSGSLVTTTTTANQIVDSNLITSVRTVKYLVQVTSNNSYQSSEIIIMHDGVNVYMNEYGSIFTNTNLAYFGADISANTLRLLVTPVNPNTVIKVIKTAISV